MVPRAQFHDCWVADSQSQTWTPGNVRTTTEMSQHLFTPGLGHSQWGQQQVGPGRNPFVSCLGTMANTCNPSTGEAKQEDYELGTNLGHRARLCFKTTEDFSPLAGR